MLALGCGGDDEPLSRDELVDQADAICAEYEERTDALAEPESPEDLAEYVEQFRPITEEGLEELRGLEPPEDLQGAYDRWLELFDERLALLDDLVEATSQGDGDRADEINREGENLEDEAERVAGEIGFRNCEREGGS